MTLTAADVMSSDVLCLDPDLQLLEAYEILADHKVSGAPVVDEDGFLLGVISRSDLIAAVEEQHEVWAEDQSYFGAYQPLSVPGWVDLPEDFNTQLTDISVGGAMTKEIVIVAHDEPIREVARVMRTQGVHRVVVVDGDRLVGIVSSMDLVRLLEGDPVEIAQKLREERPGTLQWLSSVEDHRKQRAADGG